MTATSFRTFGPMSRFDHHRRPAPFPAAGDDPERGIFYAAPEFACCVAEALGDAWVIETAGAWLAVLRLTSDLAVLDLRGRHATDAGSLAAVSSDGDRQVTQDWARYWYEHPDFAALDGLLYAGAHTGQDTLAVWERAEGRFQAVLDAPLRDRTVYGELLVVAADLGMAVDP